MERIIIFLRALIDGPWLPLVLVILILSLALVLWRIFSRKIFINKLKSLLENPEMAQTRFKAKYSNKYLLKRSKQIENFAQKHSEKIIQLTGIDALWVETMLLKKRNRDFLRVLKYAPAKGLFKCFLVSLDHKGLVPLLINWLENSGELLYMRNLALSGKGEIFNGRDALEIFGDKIAAIREMTGDPEWASRYFAIKILLHDKAEKSIRATWDAFKDSHPLIRKTVSLELITHESERLYLELFELVMKDSVFEVRQAAWQRILENFIDFYKPEPEKFKDDEVYHLLELLRVGSKQDENLALTYLESPNLELRFISAGFLEKTGTLERLCREVDTGDQQALERNFSLLEKACQVNVTSFLAVIEKTDNPATLLICGRLLMKTGSQELLKTLAKKVFLSFNAAAHMELYEITLDFIAARGSEAALILLNDQLVLRKNEPKLMEKLFLALPQRGDFIFINNLIAFFRDPDFKPRKALRDALGRMSHNLTLPAIFEILHADRKRYPHSLRLNALKLLTEMGEHYCLQAVLENLPVLPLTDARDLARILAGYPRELLNSKLEKLLNSTDAKIRAAILSILPETGENNFIQKTVGSLKDADPDVRIAAVWALVGYNDTKSLNNALSMLRDPVERVRSEVALALGAHGSPKIIENFNAVLFDENEVSSVKHAAILGLGASKSPEVINILIKLLEDDEKYKQEIIKVLSQKVQPREMAALVENFKDAGGQLRQRITECFKMMGEKGEQALSRLLEEDIASVNPYVVEILEATGFVESRIRKLAHKDASVRRDSAEFLSLVGTKAAFRGIVLAARDPDEEVRVKVIRALEKLETKDGKEILAALENDPDKRVRKYTLWALERLKSKSL